MECEKTYTIDKLEPPCESCEKPSELDYENLSVIGLWRRCNIYERGHYEMSGMPKKLRTEDIMPACMLYKASRDEIEKILLVESIVYPFILQSAKENQSGDKGKGD